MEHESGCYSEHFIQGNNGDHSSRNTTHSQIPQEFEADTPPHTRTHFVTCTVTQGKIQLACLLDSHTLRSGVCSHVCGACLCFLRSQHSSHLAGSNWAGVVMDVAQQAGVKQGQMIKGLSDMWAQYRK